MKNCFTKPRVSRDDRVIIESRKSIEFYRKAYIKDTSNCVRRLSIISCVIFFCMIETIATAKCIYMYLESFQKKRRRDLWRHWYFKGHVTSRIIRMRANVPFNVISSKSAAFARANDISSKSASLYRIHNHQLLRHIAGDRRWNKNLPLFRWVKLMHVLFAQIVYKCLQIIQDVS